MTFVDGAKRLGAKVGINKDGQGLQQLWTFETIVRREFVIFIANINLINSNAI